MNTALADVLSSPRDRTRRHTARCRALVPAPTRRAHRSLRGAAPRTSRPRDEGQAHPARAPGGDGPGFRPIKYALFPPLGLAALAGYLDPDDEVELQDEHVQRLTLDDDPDLVVMSVYITSAKRAYAIADVTGPAASTSRLGGLHVSSLPDEAARPRGHDLHRPGEDTWPAFLADLRRGEPAPRYVSRDAVARGGAAAPPRPHRSAALPLSELDRGLARLSPPLRLLLQGRVLRGRRSRSTRRPSTPALAEIERMPGRHVYFLDDHLLGNPRFAAALFEGMRGMSRVFQGASTVDAVLRPGLLEAAAEAGMRSVFVGLETVNAANLRCTPSARTSRGATTTRSAGSTTSGS